MANGDFDKEIHRSMTQIIASLEAFKEIFKRHDAQFQQALDERKDLRSRLDSQLKSCEDCREKVYLTINTNKDADAEDLKSIRVIVGELKSALTVREKIVTLLSSLLVIQSVVLSLLAVIFKLFGG